MKKQQREEEEAVEGRRSSSRGEKNNHRREEKKKKKNKKKKKKKSSLKTSPLTEILESDVNAVCALNFLLQESEPLLANFLFVRFQDSHQRLSSANARIYVRLSRNWIKI